VIDFIMFMLWIVNFLSQVIFVFLLFLGIEMYTIMQLKRKKNKNYLRQKINYNIYVDNR